MLPNKNKFTDRDLWVLEKPDYFSIIHYRNKLKFKVPTYKQALKLARKIGDCWQNQCLVYAVRDSAQINLNHRKIYKQIN
jgi:hypothetical protein